MKHYRCVVWIDHREARFFSFSKEDVEAWTIHAPFPHRHLHHKAGCIGSGKEEADQAFLHDVAVALQDCGKFLIIGPGHAKLELIRHIHAHAPELDTKLVGVETCDHPSDHQIVAHARHYFRGADRMIQSNAEILSAN